MKKEENKFIQVRIEPDLSPVLQKVAKENGRSCVKEVNFILRQVFASAKK